MPRLLHIAFLLSEMGLAPLLPITEPLIFFFFFFLPEIEIIHICNNHVVSHSRLLATFNMSRFRLGTSFTCVISPPLSPRQIPVYCFLKLVHLQCGSLQSGLLVTANNTLRCVWRFSLGRPPF